MTIADLGAVFRMSDRVRIIKDNAEVYAGYWGNFPYCKNHDEIQTDEVREIGLTTEIWHKRYQELGLDAPLHPTETPQFSFSDLNLNIWQTVTI